MPNIIDNLLPTEKTLNRGSNSTTEQPLKDKPSLFDSLLLNSLPKDEATVDTKVLSGKETKKEESLITSPELETNEDSILSPDELSSDKEKKVTTSSLLDRLILEAKKGVKQVEDLNEDTNITNKKEDSSLLDNSEVKIDVDSSKVKKEDSINLNKVETIDNIEATTTKAVDDLIVNKSDSDTQDKLDIVNINTKDNSLEIKNETDKDILLTIPTKIESNTSKITETKNKVEGNTQDVIMGKTESNVNKSIEINDKKDSNIITSDEALLNVIMADSDSSSNKTNNKTQINNSDIVLDTDISTLKELKIADSAQSNVVSNKIFDTTSIKIEEITEKVDLSIEEESLTSNVLLDNNLENSNTLEEEKPSPLVIKDSEKEKNDIELLTTKKDQKLSLMDQLIQKNSPKLTLNIENSEINSPQEGMVSKDFISSLYLGSQKNKINNQSLFNKNEAINLLKDGTSIDTVKTSAEMLDLGLESIDIDKDIDIDIGKVDVKKSNFKIENKKDFIDNILLDKNIKSDDIKGLITKSVDASNALLENTINLADDATVSVNSPLSFNIQSKIIGARQQMATMMSDISKQMYENYKPPVTAFRINLHPSTLGSIAILMKSDKSNGLSISMSVSNNTTLDSLIENQNILKNSLNKTFNENTEFNLDFSSSNQNNNQSSSNNQSNQGDNRRFEQQMDTQSILQLKEDNKDREEKSIDYM